MAGYSPWGCKESDMTKHMAHKKKKKELGNILPAVEESLPFLSTSLKPSIAIFHIYQYET